MLERPVRSGEYQPPTVTPSRRRVGSNGLPRVIISVSARENQQQHPGKRRVGFFCFVFLTKRSAAMVVLGCPEHAKVWLGVTAGGEGRGGNKRLICFFFPLSLPLAGGPTKVRAIPAGNGAL